jgi:ABC-type sugar transport system ATPase subunit
MEQQKMTPILETQQVSKAFGAVQAVKKVDWQVYPGEVTALVGDNGAGKSTLIKLITGALQADEGQILVHGVDVTINNPEDAFNYGIAAVYQDLALVESRDVVMNMFLGNEMTHGPFNLFLNHKGMQQEVERILDEEIHSRIPSVRQLVSRLSGGQRQAVAVGRALIRGGEIIIMDEPTAALGVEQTEEVLNLIRNLRERGKTVIVISHNISQVFEIADQISVMFQGNMVGTRRTKDTTRQEIVSLIVGFQADAESFA